MKEKLLTTREAANILEISEKDVIELTQVNKLPVFKVAGEYLRFKKDDLLVLKRTIQESFNVQKENVSLFSRLRDFFYFNDFYIFSSVIIVFLLWIIVKG